MCDSDCADYENRKPLYGTGEPFAWRQGLGAYERNRGDPEGFAPADGTDYTSTEFDEYCPASCIRGCYNRYPSGTDAFFRCASACRSADLKLQSRSCGGVGCSRSPDPSARSAMRGESDLPPPIRVLPLWMYWVAAGVVAALLIAFIFSQMHR